MSNISDEQNDLILKYGAFLVGVDKSEAAAVLERFGESKGIGERRAEGQGRLLPVKLVEYAAGASVSSQIELLARLKREGLLKDN